MIGARVKIQSNVYVTAFSVVEDDVFIGPRASTTNDDTMSRHAPGYALRGATLRRACRIGGGAVLVPGVEVGEEAFVAAGAVVTKDVPAARVHGRRARRGRSARCATRSCSRTGADRAQKPAVASRGARAVTIAPIAPFDMLAKLWSTNGNAPSPRSVKST